jgi:hypothetical protein
LVLCWVCLLERSMPIGSQSARHWIDQGSKFADEGVAASHPSRPACGRGCAVVRFLRLALVKPSSGDHLWLLSFRNTPPVVRRGVCFLVLSWAFGINRGIVAHPADGPGSRHCRFIPDPEAERLSQPACSSRDHNHQLWSIALHLSARFSQRIGISELADAAKSARWAKEVRCLCRRT